ncbi:MAG: hypothetical protein ACRDOA_17635 [Streptosporangiaceae bacterium]
MADPEASGNPPRRGARGRRVAALIALVLGVAGFVISGTGTAIQLLPRRFSAAQQQQIENWEIAGRWQQLTAGQIFPASVSYQLSATVLQDATSLNLNALRVAIAPQSGCGTGVTTAAASVLRHDGCKAVLRATYVDATWSYVMTVGVAVLPSAAAAASAHQSLTQPRLIAANQSEAGRLAAGILVVRYHGTAAAMYDYSRQISASFAAGPYLVMYAAGYADSRPRVPVASDHYAYAEMTSLADGVAQSVEGTLAAPPASPHCPGTPGC